MRPSTRLWLGGMSFGGVVLGHALGYLVAAPDPHDRSALLETTGHGYWPWALAIAFGLCVAGLASLLAGTSRGQGRMTPVALRLAALQVPLFVVLETAERLVGGHLDLDLFLHPAVAFGVLAQIVVAFLGAALIKGLAIVLDLLGTAQGAIPDARSTGDWFRQDPERTRRFAEVTNLTRRGPPRYVTP